eukprot:2582987-Rhodomonas_salina.2
MSDTEKKKLKIFSKLRQDWKPWVEELKNWVWADDCKAKWVLKLDAAKKALFENNNLSVLKHWEQQMTIYVALEEQFKSMHLTIFDNVDLNYAKFATEVFKQLHYFYKISMYSYTKTKKD